MAALLEKKMIEGSDCEDLGVPVMKDSSVVEKGKL